MDLGSYVHTVILKKKKKKAEFNAPKPGGLKRIKPFPKKYTYLNFPKRNPWTSSIGSFSPITVVFTSVPTKAQQIHV